MKRSAGVLLHMTALPGPRGCGDLGPAAHDFAQAIGAAGARWWQMLPVGPIGPGNSPYSSSSAFAGEPLLIDLDRLAQDGWVSRSELPRLASGASVDFRAAVAAKSAVLRRAWTAARASLADDSDFARFQHENQDWLPDFALFAALVRRFRTTDWSTWPQPLRDRRSAALKAARRELAGEVEFQTAVQFWFDRDWAALRATCRRARVDLIGDVPIFVGHGSADVWANQHLFMLDSKGRAIDVSGCPPDAFSQTGQLWGHPQYRWKQHAADGFAWWTRRMSRMFRRFDAMRVDHFLGFHRAWWIPGGAKTAEQGRYVDSPGVALLSAVTRAVGRRLIIAEDLGAVTPEAFALRDRFRLPGMRVLQFGFDGGDDYHQPHAYPRRSVAYSGTHDNDTLAGWLASLPGQRATGGDGLTRAERVARYAGVRGKRLRTGLLRKLFASRSELVVVPMQDLLGLGGRARFNTPGVARGNWSWRMSRAAIHGRGMKELAEWIGESGR